MIRRIFLFSILAIALFCIGIWRLSDGFSVAHITDSLPWNARLEVESPPLSQIRSILSQSFTYSGKGSQCYVFESADKQYVLKFFRLSRYRLPHFQQALPLPPFLAHIQNTRLQQKEIKKEELFSSCQLAYTELQEETGLLYLHLNKTTHLAAQVILYDNLKQAHPIAIDHYAFIIQKRAEKMYSYLGRLIKEGNDQETRRALASLSALLNRREQKGIVDKDAEIHKNIGFRNGKAMFLDTGQFYKTTMPENRERMIHKLLTWIETKDSQLALDAHAILATRV